MGRLPPLLLGLLHAQVQGAVLVHLDVRLLGGQGGTLSLQSDLFDVILNDV